MERAQPKIPFVGLHAHSVAGSAFDGFGYPQEHMDFAYKNGMQALALTDHGNMNGLSYQVLHAKKMKATGKEYVRAKEDKKTAKKMAAEADKVTSEDEGASKRKSKNKINARRHIVLVALNQTGLSNIYKIVSDSHQGDNFYRYPRLDYEMLEKYGEGVIASSACLGGVYAGDYWDNCIYEEYVNEKGKTKSRKIGEDEDAILSAMRETTKCMLAALGDRWYGELQWNNVPEQHRLNKYVIQMQKEFGIELISTADSHYPEPDSWKDRELYKRLAWLNATTAPDYLKSELPDGIEEMGMELYPKNGDQMWQSYQTYSNECGVSYDDDIVRDSLVKTHWIAHELVEDFMPDDTVRLPGFVVPEGVTGEQALINTNLPSLAKEGSANTFLL